MVNKSLIKLFESKQKKKVEKIDRQPSLKAQDEEKPSNDPSRSQSYIKAISEAFPASKKRTKAKVTPPRRHHTPLAEDLTDIHD